MPILSIFEITFESLCTLIIFKKALSSHTICWLDFLFISVYTIILSFIPQELSLYNWGAAQIITVCYFSIVRHNIISGFFYLAVCSFTLVISQVICIIPMAVLSNILPDYLLGLSGNILSLFIILLLYKFRKARKLLDALAIGSIYSKLLLVNSYILMSAIVILLKNNMQFLYHNPFIVISIFSFVVAINLFVLYYDQKIEAQKLEITTYQKNFNIYKDLIDEVRAHQHLYSNRIQTLQHIKNTCNSYDDLIRSIDLYFSSENESMLGYTLLQIDKPILAASLYSQSLFAEREHLSILFDITSTKIESNVNELILADLATALLQNAIEASTAGDTIYVKISSVNGRFQFDVRNPVSEYISSNIISNYFNKGYSTKSTLKSDSIPHGLGLYEVKKIIIKNKGEIFADCLTFENEYEMRFCFTL